MPRTIVSRVLGAAMLALIGACGAEQFRPGAADAAAGGGVVEPGGSGGAGLRDQGTGGSSGDGGGDSGQDAPAAMDLAMGSGGSSAPDGSFDRVAADLPRDAAPDVTIPCPGPVSGCTCKLFGGHVYGFCTAGKVFTDAQSDCLNLGMKLVRIDGTSENQWLYDVAVAQALIRPWIGATARGTRGVWRWMNGAQFWNGAGAMAGGTAVGGLFSAWDGPTDEPKGTSAEECGALQLMRPTWVDLECGRPNPYICETYL